MFAVNGVHGGKVLHVSQVDVAFNNIIKCFSGGSQHCRNVFKNLGGLCACVACHQFASAWVYGCLAGQKYQAVFAFYTLGVRADGFGGEFTVDGFAAHACILFLLLKFLHIVYWCSWVHFAVPEIVETSANRFKLVLEWDGTGFAGWQSQSQGERTVQDVLETALVPFGLLGRVMAAGRTDAGVHALAMPVHVVISHNIAAPQLLRALNARLPQDVRVLTANATDEDFHARFSCKWRAYRYRILSAPIPSALERNRVLWIPQRLEVAPMRHAAKWLEGEHDFAAFATQEERQTVRRLFECSVRSLPMAVALNHASLPGRRVANYADRTDQLIEVHLVGESFLRHMVRGIVGTLLEVGLGKIESGQVRRILESRQRDQAGPNVAAHGLYFLEAGYEAWE